MDREYQLPMCDGVKRNNKKRGQGYEQRMDERKLVSNEEKTSLRQNLDRVKAGRSGLEFQRAMGTRRVRSGRVMVSFADSNGGTVSTGASNACATTAFFSVAEL